MSALSPEMTVGDLVKERPSRSRVFEKLGIDFCCGGKMPLSQACAKKKLDVQDVIKQLEQDDQQTDAIGTSRLDPNAMSLTDLADHIQHTHHAYLKQELPRLSAMVHKVASVHGQHHAWTIEIDQIYQRFAEDFQSHSEREERMLFPMIRQLDALGEDGRLPEGFSVARPIQVMEQEHDETGDAIEKMSNLSNGFAPPADACTTFRAMLEGLKYLELDTHQHVHKENNILFVKALALEAKKNQLEHV